VDVWRKRGFYSATPGRRSRFIELGATPIEIDKYTLFEWTEGEFGTPSFSSLSHVGRSAHRLDDNPLEKEFADEWRELNSGEGRGHGVLASLMARNPNKPEGEVTQRDAMVAATIIQWLGSPVGQGFVEKVLEKHHGASE